MPLTLPVETTRTIGLEELVEIVTKTIDPDDFESALAAAEPLRALANNRSFLVEHLNAELRHWESFQEGSVFSAQSLVLARGKHFIVRAVTWEPVVASSGDSRSLQESLFDYRVPHDHNFSFLTVGYLGSGYETTVYDYDRSKVVGYPGEQVDLRFIERTTLPKGKVMAYQACKDVHVQAPPVDLSVSINLLLNTPRAAATEQYLFDLETGVLTGIGSSPTASQRSLCRLAPHLADGETVDLLEAIASRHACPSTRASAFESLAVLEPESGERIWAVALGDPHEAVRRRASGQLDRISQGRNRGSPR